MTSHDVKKLKNYTLCSLDFAGAKASGAVAALWWRCQRCFLETRTVMSDDIQ